MKKIIKYPCISCVYIKQCGNKTRTQLCNERTTLREENEKLMNEVEYYKHEYYSECDLREELEQKLKDEKESNQHKLPSIKTYGKIMQSAFESCSPCSDYCTYLDCSEFTEEDFVLFLKEFNEEKFHLTIDGYAETLDELEDITFLGEFILCFEEGQKYREDIKKIYKEQENEERI